MGDGPRSAAAGGGHVRLRPDERNLPQSQFVLASGVAGVVAGVAGTLLGFPMDVVKTQMQAHPGAPSVGAAARAVYAKHGLGGFYRGVWGPLAALTVLNGQTFSLHAWFRDRLGSSALAGACCGPFAAILSTPFDLIKVRVALGVARTSLEAASELARRHALYLGHTVNALRECVFLGVYFGTYDVAKAQGAAVPVAGSVAGATAWLLSYPLDCVKTNVQKVALEKGLETTKTYSHKGAAPITTSSSSRPEPWWRVARALVAERSFAGLYRGVGPSVLRACVVSATRFSAFELALDRLLPIVCETGGEKGTASA